MAPHEVLGDTSRGFSSYMPHVCLNKICFAVSPAPERNQEVQAVLEEWKTYGKHMSKQKICTKTKT